LNSYGAGVVPRRYRELFASRALRGLLTGMGVSKLGTGLSTVTIAWLAVRVAPAGHRGLFVGIALAADSLPGAGGAFALGRVLRGVPARALVLGDCTLRAGMLGAVAVLSLAGGLSPALYVALLGGSSLLSAWGSSGQYALLSELSGPQGRLSANSAASAQSSLAFIAGPALAGVLLTHVAPGWLLAADAGSFVCLGVAAVRLPVAHDPPAHDESGPAASRPAASGFAALRSSGLYGLLAVTWLFFFLYGPVEDALPVYVARHAHAHAGLLGAYWSAFGVGALVATLLTGVTRLRLSRLLIVVVIAGWGACLVPFAFAPVGATLVCFALGGLIYGPFIPLTYALFQSLAGPAELPSVLAALSAVTIVASPLGTAVGGPLIAWLGAAGTITASGAATVALAAVTCLVWRDPAVTERLVVPSGAGSHDAVR
jgi:MFS family permease